MKKEMYQSMYDTETYHWWFKAKYEIVLSVLETMGLRENSNADIADFGCGCGLVLQYLSRYGHVTGFDFSADALQFSRQNFDGELIQANLEEYNGTDKFDYAVALDVFEHIQDDARALKNTFNAMRPNGVCVFTVPAFMCLWSQHDENLMHKRRYTKAEFIERVRESGFSIRYCSYYNFWAFPPAYLVRKAEKIFKIKNQDSHLEHGIKAGFLNTLLYKIFVSEKYIIKRSMARGGGAFPFGVSIICVATKTSV